MNNFIVWDKNGQYDLFLSKQVGAPWFEDIEIVTQKDCPAHVRNYAGKKIVLVEYYCGQFLEIWPLTLDLSWADLVVCFDSEYVASKQGYYKQAVKTFKNSNIVFITGGIGTDPNDVVANNRFFSPYLAFFHRSIMGNYDVKCNYTNTRPYLFDVLLGGKKYHRLFVYNKLKETKLIDSSIVALKTTPFDTYLEDGGDMSTPSSLWRKRPDVEDFYSPVLDQLEDPDMLEFKRINKQLTALNSSRIVPWRFYKDSPSNVQLSIIISPKVYENSWYSIISETTYGPFLFLTEKTAKPMYCKRIFVSFSFVGHLQFLRSLGFKTFDGIIDESYDQETNHDKRFAMAWQQVEYLASTDPIEVYQKASEILDHNYQLMQQITYTNNIQVQNFIKQHLNLLT